MIIGGWNYVAAAYVAAYGTLFVYALNLYRRVHKAQHDEDAP
jgi:hypothetical protein